MATYICSDIHGQYRLFLQMLEKIQFSNDDKMYILGDLVDRGPESLELLQDVMQRKNIICLLGNHEQMMYGYIRERYSGYYSHWLYGCNGGQETYIKFNKLNRKEQNRILDYIRDMYLQVEISIGDNVFLLTHSAFLSDVGTVKWKKAYPEDVEFVTWNSPWRSYEYVSPSLYQEDKRMHIIGHVPTIAKPKMWLPGKMPETPTAYVNKEYNIVNIDCGCAWIDSGEKEGALCCMNLEKFANDEDAFVYFMPENTNPS